MQRNTGSNSDRKTRGPAKVQGKANEYQATFQKFLDFPLSYQANAGLGGQPLSQLATDPSSLVGAEWPPIPTSYPIPVWVLLH